MGMTEILPANSRYYNSCGQKTIIEKLGQPANQIDALGGSLRQLCGPKLSGRPDQGHDGLCLDLLHTIFSAQFRSFTMKHACWSIFEKGGDGRVLWNLFSLRSILVPNSEACRCL
jgi:hypothetical protein